MTNVLMAFKVVTERSCPLYEINDRFVLNDNSLMFPAGQPACLILVREFTNIILPWIESENPAVENDVFSCGGCTGLIKFRMNEMPEDPEQITEVPGHSPRGETGLPGTDALKKSNVVVSGSLEQISPSELLQFFHMHQKTGKLLLDVARGTARVAFREGAIIGARYGEQEDKAAIFRILGEGRGKFTFLTGIPPSLREVDEIGDFMMILMEGLKRLDESREEKE